MSEPKTIDNLDDPEVIVSVTRIDPVFNDEDIGRLIANGRIRKEDATMWRAITLDPSIETSPGVVHASITTADMLDHVRWLARRYNND